MYIYQMYTSHSMYVPGGPRKHPKNKIEGVDKLLTFCGSIFMAPTVKQETIINYYRMEVYIENEIVSRADGYIKKRNVDYNL